MRRLIAVLKDPTIYEYEKLVDGGYHANKIYQISHEADLAEWEEDVKIKIDGFEVYAQSYKPLQFQDGAYVKVVNMVISDMQHYICKKLYKYNERVDMWEIYEL